jgi:hypothetical protein
MAESQLVKIIFESSEKDISLPVFDLLFEGESPEQLSDRQIIERVARRLGRDIARFRNSIVTRSKTSDIVILPGSAFDQAATADPERIATIAEAQTRYQADEVLAEDTFDQTIMAQLEAAADHNDSRTFARIIEQVDWESQPVEQFIQVIDLAMSLGYLPLARELTTKGRIRFPTNKSLIQTERALAPAVVRGFKPAMPGLADTIEWMRKHAAEYEKGQWLAVRSGELLAVASSLDELIEAVGGLEELSENSLIHKVI